MEIKILFGGTHHHFVRNGTKYIDDITSSAALLKGNGQLILIDTGSPMYEEKLLSALKENSVNPEDINWIIETHLHPDHVGNNHLFKNAKRVEGNKDDKNIVFSGDAIRSEMLEENYMPEGQDIPKIITSASQICDIADQIIPGHGPNLQKEEITKIKNNLLKLKK